MFDLPLRIDSQLLGNAAGINGIGADGFSLYAALRDASVAAGATGAKLVSWPFDPRLIDFSLANNMVNNRTMLVPQLVKAGIQIDGVAWIQNQNGNYTAVNSNQIGAYTYDGANFTRQAVSVSDGTLWQSGIGFRTKAFSSPYIPGADMLLWAAGLYNSSAAVTIPQIIGDTLIAGGKNLGLDVAPPIGYGMFNADNATPNLAATIANAALVTTTTNNYWLAFYHLY